jgi:hypothetical protein
MEINKGKEEYNNMSIGRSERKMPFGTLRRK